MLKYDSVHFGLMKNPSDFIHLAAVVQTLQSTPGNSTLQGKQIKGRVIRSSSFILLLFFSFNLLRVKLYRKINVLKGNKNCFKLAACSSYREFELVGVNCTLHYPLNQSLSSR